MAGRPPFSFRADVDLSTFSGRLAMRIREICMQRNMDARAVAARIGRAPKTVRDWMAGRCTPSIYILRQLADVLEVTLDDLVPR